MRILSLLGASYGWAVLLGFLGVGVIYPLAAAIYPAADARLLVVVLVIAGPAAGALVTFLSRRIIDVAMRLSPDLGSDFDKEPAFEVRTAVAISSIVVAAALLVLISFGGGGHGPPSPGKCLLSRDC